ncbi:MAG: 4Fe-4S dicluster domain-containing protein, partial [Bacteroidota bacterium]
MEQSECSRRQFFKYLALAGVTLSLGKIRSVAAKNAKIPDPVPAKFDYQFRTFSVDHLQEVKKWFEQLKNEHRISNNKTFQSYIGGFCFDKRAYLPNAKSFIVFSVPQNLQSIIFNHEGAKYDIRIPTGYTSTGMTGAALRNRIRKDVIGDPSKKLKGNEHTFLDYCQRCSQCVQACPTGFIQPAISQAGIAGVWTPVVNAQSGYCEWSCNKCTQVCPSGAIEKLTLKRKQEFKIGIAVIDKDRCYTYADGYNCSVCHDGCPIPQKAIRYRETETWNYQGRKVNVKQIYVDPDRCTGCGICENVCPRTDAPGIFITAQDEY